MAGRDRGARGIALPVLLSLAFHGFFLAALALIPTTVARSPHLPVETCVCVSVDLEAEPGQLFRAATVRERATDASPALMPPILAAAGSSEESEFVAVVEPLPRQGPPLQETAPAL